MRIVITTGFGKGPLKLDRRARLVHASARIEHWCSKHWGFKWLGWLLEWKFRNYHRFTPKE
jgi:hypothetical protein